MNDKQFIYHSPILGKGIDINTAKLLWVLSIKRTLVKESSKYLSNKAKKNKKKTNKQKNNKQRLTQEISITQKK